MKKERTSPLLSFKQILESFMGEEKGLFSDGMRLQKLSRTWEELVDPKFQGLTEPVKLRRRCLWVSSQNPVILQEMAFQKEALQKKINEKMGDGWVEKIQFVIS